MNSDPVLYKLYVLLRKQILAICCLAFISNNVIAYNRMTFIT